VAKARLAQGERRLVAVSVLMAETGPTWVMPGIRCPPTWKAPAQHVATPEDEEARRRDFDYVAELNRYIALYRAPPGCVPIWTERTFMGTGQVDSGATRPLPTASDLGRMVRPQR
jgi:hypothetical protein